MRRLADEVGVDEDGQTHTAGADVSDREGHLAGQGLLDAERPSHARRAGRSWGQGRGSSARRATAGPLTEGAVPPTGTSAPESDGPVTGKGTKGNWRAWRQLLRRPWGSLVS